MERKLTLGGNLFQVIKGWTSSYGGTPLKLSIGQPEGPAPKTARDAAAVAIKSEEESMHEYQDNGSPGCPGFAENFVRANLSMAARQMGIDPVVTNVLPIPGIKPVLAQILMACRDNPKTPIGVLTDTGPGYPTPEVMAYQIGYGQFQHSVGLDSLRDFMPSVKNIDEHRRNMKKYAGVDLGIIMLNRPHNPTGQIMTMQAWRELCTYCVEHGIRLFNDGAYTLLDHSGYHVPLALIAREFPELSWAEAFSASKLGNMTGWRIGAMVGSEDFMADLSQIKGEVDSGFNAALATGVNALVTTDMETVEQIRLEYDKRLKIFNRTVKEAGMFPAVNSNSGFFTFFHTPKEAFGVRVDDAKAFNQMMIKETGIIGVHFGEFIRYSVSTCKFTDSELQRVFSGFSDAKLKY